MSSESDADPEADARKVLAGLIQDASQLTEWVDSDIAAFGSILRDAAITRSHAHGLADSTGRQGADRQTQEEQLFLERVTLRQRLEALPSGEREWEYLDLYGPRLKPHASGRTSDWRRSGNSYTWEDWVTGSACWEAIDAATQRLLGEVESQFHRRDATQAETRRAVEAMERCVDRARLLSSIRFAQETTPPRGDAVVASLPLVGFLLVALLGVVVSPADGVSLVAAAILVFAVLGSGWRMWRAGRSRPVEVTALAAGASLAFFTACYLVAFYFQSRSLELDDEALTSIGDIAMTALMVGFTGGTIGVDLAGAARVIAFVQILLTVAAIASGIGWAWKRMTDRADRLDAIAAPPLRGDG